MYEYGTYPDRPHGRHGEQTWDIRPLVTRYRLKRRRRRTAATLLAGASLACAFSALKAPDVAARTTPSGVPVTAAASHDADASRGP